MSYEQVQISIVRSGNIENAEIFFKRENLCTLKIIFLNQQQYEVTDYDLFSCFCHLREHFPDILFLCKGAKENVYPSRMSRDMSGGLMAYECSIGKHASRENLVGIFDFEDKDITSPEKQRRYYLNWIESLQK